MNTTLAITLSDASKAFAEQQAAEGHYPSVSVYLDDLIRAERRRKAHARVEALLREGLRSEAREMTQQDWEAIRQEGLAILKAERERTAP